MKPDDENASVAVVVEVLPPEKEVGVYGQSMDGEAVRVAFPSTLDDGPADWRDIDLALLSSYCDDQDIKLYNYKHTNLDFATNLFTPGDRGINTSYDEPDVAVVVVGGEGPTDDTVTVVYSGQLGDGEIPPVDLASHCEEQQLKQYSYCQSDLEWAE